MLKSNYLKWYGYSKCECCIFTRQYTITKLGNTLKICLVFGESEAHYAYKSYAYKKTCSNSNQFFTMKMNTVLFKRHDNC